MASFIAQRVRGFDGIEILTVAAGVVVVVTAALLF
jgi:hypothetical protein